MISQHYFTIWKETRTITYQIAETMKNDPKFNLDFKPHPEMNTFGHTTSHLNAVVYHMLKNYLKIPGIKIPEQLYDDSNYDIFKDELDKTDALVKKTFNELSDEDLDKEAYFWEPTNTSYSKGWVVLQLIAHERWTQAQLKMYLKIMGCDTSNIGH